MKILLVGNGHRQNRGCEAIAITTIELLRKKMPDVEIEILSLEPEIDKYFEKYDIKVSNLRNPEPPKPDIFKRIINKLKRKLFLKDSAVGYERILLPYKKKLATCDIVLSLGGDNYSDDYGVPYLFFNLAIMAKEYNKPFVIWSASVGPFKSAKSLKLAMCGLKCTSLITAREDETIKYLQSIKYKGKVVRVFDSAFILGIKKVSFPVFARKAEVIGFNIAPLYYRYTSKSYDEVLDISKKFLCRISKDYNILLIPHVVWEKVFNNDAVYMEPLAKELDNVILANPDYDCMQLKYLISKCSYFIGSRTHATIAAFSTGVPTLSLGYSRKSIGLNYDLFDSNEFLLSSKELNLDVLLDKFDYLEKNKERAKRCLLEKQYKFEVMVNVGVDALEKLL